MEAGGGTAAVHAGGGELDALTVDRGEVGRGSGLRSPVACAAGPVAAGQRDAKHGGREKEDEGAVEHGLLP